jgi:DNA-binding MarR family transcriptional regulator
MQVELSEFDRDLREEVTHCFRRLFRAVCLRSHELSSKYGLSGPQALLMKDLLRYSQRSVGELTRDLHSSQATVTGIIDRLEKRSLLRRERGFKDKRQVFVSLTEQGRELAENAPPLLGEKFLQSFDRLQNWERTQMLSTLQRVVSMMETPAEMVETVELSGFNYNCAAVEDAAHTNS